MSQLKLVFVGSLAVLIGITVFERLNQPSEAVFVEVPLPNEISSGEVVVSGLLTCPHSGAKTRSVLDKLTEAQIPHKHLTSFGFSNTDDWAGVHRLNEILKRGAPVVFVNGKAKADPTPEEVIAEYRKASR
ncbi:MAG: hypothetical protein NW224_20480 [Leptolyngbyaceae cyanobacterium bins.302]|nr:hypothetical protein [Leptolyngbyaceae cyanobacterium bins.302]